MNAVEGWSAPLICNWQRESRSSGVPFPLSAATIAFQFVERIEDAAHANSFLMGLGIKSIVGRRRDNVIEQAGKRTVGNDHCIVFTSAKILGLL